MDAIPFIKQMISQPALGVFLSNNVPDRTTLSVEKIMHSDISLTVIGLMEGTEDEKLDLIENMRDAACKIGIIWRKTMKDGISDFYTNNLVKEWKKTQNSLVDAIVSCYNLKQRETEGELEQTDIDAVFNSLNSIKIIEDFLLDNANSSNYLKDNEKSRAVLLVTAFPAIRELEYSKLLKFLFELSKELDNLPDLICKSCEGQPMALLLIGSLLSLKQRDYDTWNKVKDDLPEIRELSSDESDNGVTNNDIIREFSSDESDNGATDNDMIREFSADESDNGATEHDMIREFSSDESHNGAIDNDNIRKFSSDESDNGATDNQMWHIFTCCYNDLPYILKPCFLYLACYPIDYEIPAKSLTEIWIAEGFITPVKGETLEETAYKYLEQLVQRSLVCVSKRSLLGTIKCCRVHQSIHKFAIKQCCNKKFLSVNPNRTGMKSVDRVAIHHHNNQQDLELTWAMKIYSFLAFDFDRNIVFHEFAGTLMRVLELRNSTIPEGALLEMTNLRYLKILGLRGCNISELPENIGDMENLRTLDVRGTRIKTLPESLWTISKLRHVYVNPSSQIKSPPSTANLLYLQILKTVIVHESWIEKYPQSLIHLKKLALSNRDNSEWKSNPYWESISKLLSEMVNLLSLEIIGNIVPSEFVDTRAFPNLNTVKSIKLEGEWNYKKLFIDNIKFPTNLVKLTLTKSGLKEDPMSTLGRLQALKYLCLQDGAYAGKKMVCSENGFPLLRFLKLSKLENLEIWEMNPMAMSQLTTLRVVQCLNLYKLPDLEHVTDISYIY